MARELTSRFAGRIRWIGFENQSGEDIPPFSIVEASGWQMPDPSGSAVSVTSPMILGDQPEDPINPYACYITGAATVPAGGNGVCARPTFDLPLLVSVSGSQQDPNDAPFRMCGPSNGSWQATRDTPGFAMVDLPQQGYALVVPSSPGASPALHHDAGSELDGLSQARRHPRSITPSSCRERIFPSPWELGIYFRSAIPRPVRPGFSATRPICSKARSSRPGIKS